MRKDTKKREEEIEDTEMKEKQGVRSKGRGEYVNTWQIWRKTKIDKRRDKRQMKKMSKKGREREDTDRKNVKGRDITTEEIRRSKRRGRQERKQDARWEGNGERVRGREMKEDERRRGA